jgi:hypothetical protein
MFIRTLKLYLAVGLLSLFTAVQAELIDRGDGMIYDTVLDITWLQDAHYALTSGYDDDGYMTWYEAVEWADQLVYAGFNDWRLASRSVSAGTPVGTVESVESLVNCHTESEEACRDNEYGYMFVHNLDGSLFDDLTGNQTSTNNVELQNIQYGYWSNSQYLDYFEAFVFFFGGGGSLYDGKTSHWAAWAVRDGDIDDPPCPTPAQPDELTAKLRRDTVYLSWQPSEDATSYDVYRRLNYDDYVTIANTDQNTYADRLPGGTRGVEYYVVAVNNCGESMASNKVALSIRTKGR